MSHIGKLDVHKFASVHTIEHAPVYVESEFVESESQNEIEESKSRTRFLSVVEVTLGNEPVMLVYDASNDVMIELLPNRPTGMVPES